MKRLILILMLSIFILTGCNNVISFDKESAKAEFLEDYKSLDLNENSVFYKVDYNTIKRALMNKEGMRIILFAFNPKYYECPYCMAVIPIINDVAIEEGITEILYYDIYQIRMENSSKYQRLLNYITKQVDDLEIRDKKEQIVVPDLYVVQDGEILEHHIATLKDEYGNWIKDLNDENINTLKTLYRNMFKKQFKK